MCGRMSIFFDSEFARNQKELMIDKVESEFGPSFNVAPSQKVPVIIKGSRILDTYKWGLIPSWAKDKSIGNKLINARAEGIAEKPSFRSSFDKRRCLVLSSGFFEWDKEKHPHLIKLKNKKVVTYAGIWDEWKSPEGDLIRTVAIITTNPNDFMKNIHHRMPVILEPKDYDEWLNAEDSSTVQHLLTPLDSNKMIQYEVSKEVNNPRNNNEDIIKPL